MKITTITFKGQIKVSRDGKTDFFDGVDIFVTSHKIEKVGIKRSRWIQRKEKMREEQQLTQCLSQKVFQALFWLSKIKVIKVDKTHF